MGRSRSDELVLTVIRPSTSFLASDMSSLDILLPLASVQSTGSFLNPGTERRSFPSGVCELDSDRNTLRADEIDDPLERGDLAVSPNSCIFRRYTPFWYNGSGFYADGTDTSSSQRTEVDEVPVGGMTVVRRV